MLAAIIKTLEVRSFVIYSRPYELNILGIRNDSTIPNRFDDEIHVFFKNNSNQWVHYIFWATTDPGTYWLENPLSPQGTAILMQGQYRNAYQIGLHRGKYYALVQRLPVTVIRDYDRNAVLDFFNGTQETGLFGINIHHASVNGTTKTVDKYSAGCQVLADINHFNLFMQLCEKHRTLYGNSFTYTLIDKRALIRNERKKLVINVAGIGAGITTGFIVYKLIN
ncbi:MAG: hypothetical protein QM764_08995 [Chitinophagaceae bacterium]